MTAPLWTVDADVVVPTRLLEKDLLYVDLRAPGKMFVRLSEEAAAHRAEAMAAKKKGKGGQT